MPPKTVEAKVAPTSDQCVVAAARPKLRMGGGAD